MPKLVVAGVPEHFNVPWHIAIQDGIFLSKGRNNNSRYKSGFSWKQLFSDCSIHLGVQVEFKEVPEGTGKMCAGLRDGSFDVAVLLTEGIVKDIAFRILRLFFFLDSYSRRYRSGKSFRYHRHIRGFSTYVRPRTLAHSGAHHTHTRIHTKLSLLIRWAVVTGPQSPINSIDELKGKVIGISRYGSGSHLMSFVLADVCTFFLLYYSLQLLDLPLWIFSTCVYNLGSHCASKRAGM